VCVHLPRDTLAGATIGCCFLGAVNIHAQVFGGTPVISVHVF
jgi:hypothetical protein